MFRAKYNDIQLNGDKHIALELSHDAKQTYKEYIVPLDSEQNEVLLMIDQFPHAPSRSLQLTLFGPIKQTGLYVRSILTPAAMTLSRGIRPR